MNPDVEQANALSDPDAGRLAVALASMQAYRYAQDLGLSEWSFAVEIDVLRAADLTDNDLRWLVCKNYLEHARELTPLGEDVRTFRETGRLRFCRKTCFVLTAAGAAFFRAGRVRTCLGGEGPPALPPLAVARPRWDADRQELRMGADLVKQFKVPARNQEVVLAAFEEEGWPHRIDDPIPPQCDSDQKRRLHDTIVSLNRNQKYPLIRFLGDGSGEGVRWEAAHRPAAAEACGAPPPPRTAGSNGHPQVPPLLPRSSHRAR